MELARQSTVVEIGLEIDEAKADSVECQTKLGRSAIICAGCPMVRFCELKSELEPQVTMPDEDFEDTIPEITVSTEALVVEAAPEAKPIMLNNLAQSHNITKLNISDRAALPADRPYNIEVRVAESESMTPLPYEAKNTTPSYLDRLMDDSVNVVIANSIAGPSLPKVDSVVAADNSYMPEAVNNVGVRQALTDRVARPLADKLEELAGIAEKHETVKMQSVRPELALRLVEATIPDSTSVEVPLGEPTVVIDTLPVRDAIDIAYDSMIVLEEAGQKPVAGGDLHVRDESIIVEMRKDESILEKVNEMQPGHVISMAIDIITLEQVTSHEHPVVESTFEPGNLAAVEQVSTGVDISTSEVKPEIGTGVEDKAGLDEIYVQDFEFWEQDLVDDTDFSDGLRLSEVINVQPGGVTYQAMIDSEDDLAVEFRQANSMTNIGYQVADILLRELARRAIQVRAI